MHSALVIAALLAARQNAQPPLAAAAERVRVIVALRDPDVAWPWRSQIERRHRSDVVQEVQQRVLDRLEGRASVYARWSSVAGFAAEVTKEDLERLRSDPDVIAVDPDAEVRPLLAQSVPLIRGDTVRNSGYTGAGVTVAVLDTGVQRSHPDLQDAVIDEACFCATTLGGGCCANGRTSQLGTGSAADDDGHGTHVAGIIASRGVVASPGVAPGSRLVAVKVLGGSSTAQSSTISGMDWILSNHPETRVVNMSLGTSTLFSGNCDSANASTISYASAISRLRSNGTLVVAASGNDGSTSQMVAPACVQNALSVGAVYDANLGAAGAICTDATTAPDKIACFSNASSTLDLLAPGAKITSSGLGGVTANKSGTSMASPHVAGAAAVLLAAQPALGPADVESILKSSGVPIVDARNGMTFPRIDVEAALLRVLYGSVPTVATPTATAILAVTARLGGNVTSAGNSMILERGIVYAPALAVSAPRIGGSLVTKAVATGTTGTFTVDVTGLSESTEYSFRAYAMNVTGTAYSAVGSFKTLGMPIVIAPTVIAVTSASAEIWAIVGTDGGMPVSERGFVLAPTAVNASPSVGGAGVTKIVVSGTVGEMTAVAPNLNGKTAYTFRAYAKSAAGTGYSASSSFTTLGGLASARTEHTATLLPDGKVLIVGGYSSQSGGALSTSEIFDVGTTSFVAGGNLTKARYDHTATLLLDGKVLVVGGRGNDDPASAEIYDPAKGTFTATGRLLQGRYAHSATLLPDGKVLIAGGFNAAGVALARAEIYDPAAGTFAPAGALATARAQHVASLLSPGKVLIAGGYSSQIGGAVTDAELFDEAASTFTSTGSLLTARHSAASAVLPSGALIVTGGFSTGFGALATAEIYDPALPIFGTLADMSTSRMQHTATLLPTGEVLLAGGSSPARGGVIADMEVYAPSTGSYTAARPLAFARAQHTATLLTDGRVLIAGGTGAGGASLSTVELYAGSTATIAAPAVLNATANGSSRVDLAWSVVPGAVRYEVFRAETINGTWSQIGTTPSTFLTAAGGMLAGKTYLFKVRAAGLGATSDFSPVDAATLVSFADPVLDRTIVVKAVHLTELRAAVNAMRAAAELTPASFTDATIDAGSTIIRRVHVTEMRSALDDARTAIGLAALTYTDPTLPAQTAVKAKHISELRAGTQ